jgi:endonuclease I
MLNRILTNVGSRCQARSLTAMFAFTLCWAQNVSAGPPAGYYDTVDDTNSTTMRATLHDVIDDHLRFPYSSTNTDTWDILDLADEDPNDSSNILDVYKNASYPKAGAGNSNYQREHTWPSSYGFPNNVVANMPFTDCHMLHLVDGGYNTSRGNRVYDTCSAACTEKVTDFNNGQGGSGGTGYPGNSNWGTGAGSTGTWETWNGKKGDVARAMFYMDIRYEGGTHGVTGVAEPDLILTDNRSLIVSNTSTNQSIAYMGILSTLLQWNIDDPVDQLELDRNDLVFNNPALGTGQGNRNPFVDHPEWVECLFNNACGCMVNDDCDDNLFCNGTETCVSGSCQTGSDPCPGQGCDEVNDVCTSCNDDGTCDAGEDCNNCPSDCPMLGAFCGNNICETADGEDCEECPGDCNNKLNGNPNNRYCCGDGTAQYGITCADSLCTGSGNTCTDVPAPTSCCGDGTCEGAETIPNCAIDCAECVDPGDCNDADPCTINDCIASACSYTPMDCNDSDACTDDSCSGGVCFNDPISCDDSESCTTDSCDSSTGCENVWPACGAADGCCDPGNCNFSNDPDCACGGQNAPCTQDGDCCSNNCKNNGKCARP